MATIIQLPTTDADNRLAAHSQAGWLLVYAALWQHDRFSAQEVSGAQQMIRQLLNNGTNPKAAFIQFCERVLLAHRLLQADPSDWVDVPAIWLHPQYGEGYTGTITVYEQVVNRRKQVAGYQQGIHVLATAYWQYLHQPNIEIIQRCYKRLLRLREYGLLQLWNNVIILLQMQTASHATPNA